MAGKYDMPTDPARLSIEGRRYVVLPEEDYEQLVGAAEMREDVARYDAAMARLDAGESEIIPEEIANRLFAGESPLRVWREYRGMTQVELAAHSGVDRSHISRLETGEGLTRTADNLRKLAGTLGVAIDDLVPTRGEE